LMPFDQLINLKSISDKIKSSLNH